MREKKPALIITFPSTAAAMEAESFCLEQGLPAWRAPPEAETLLTGALGTAGLAWSDARVLEV